MPARAGQDLARRLGLKAHTPPLELPALDVMSLWHARLDVDPLQAWVRAALIDASASPLGSSHAERSG